MGSAGAGGPNREASQGYPANVTAIRRGCWQTGESKRRPSKLVSSLKKKLLATPVPNVSIS